MVGAVIPEEEIEDLDLDMDQFEDDMERMLDVNIFVLFIMKQFFSSYSECNIFSAITE